MNLFGQIIAVYPELTIDDFHLTKGKINLRQDADGIQYITKWEYEKPLPEGMKIGK